MPRLPIILSPPLAPRALLYPTPTQLAAMRACDDAGKLHRFRSIWRVDAAGADIHAKTIQSLARAQLMTISGRVARLTPRGRERIRAMPREAAPVLIPAAGVEPCRTAN
jgi:hypothetical protein